MPDKGRRVMSAVRPVSAEMAADACRQLPTNRSAIIYYSLIG